MTADELVYLLNSKRQLDISTAAKDCATWNTFISAFNDSDRVKLVFANIPAKNKYWLALTEYSYTAAELPQDFSVLSSHCTVESDFLIETFGAIPLKTLSGGRLCIDITGLMRPQILFSLRYLRSIGVVSFEMLYTEHDREVIPHQPEKKNVEIVLRILQGSNPVDFGTAHLRGLVHGRGSRVHE